MVRVVVVKVSWPLLWFAEMVPLRAPTRLPEPPVGAVWVTTMVRLVGLLIVAPVPVVVARMSPKLKFVGVLKVADAEPVKVKVRLLVVPQVTMFVPFPDVAPALV